MTRRHSLFSDNLLILCLEMLYYTHEETLIKQPLLEELRWVEPGTVT